MAIDKSAHFNQVKEKNKRIVRNILRMQESVSIAALADMATLSYPTVSGLLKELTKENQVQMCQEVESCGGRPGVRYRLNEKYRYGLVAHVEDYFMVFQVIDYAGQEVARGSYEMPQQATVDQVFQWVESMKKTYPKLSVLSMGIPGVVCDNAITHFYRFPGLMGSELAERIENELGIQVFLENDVNAIVYAEIGETPDFAHVAYMDGCIGVGIVLGGEVRRGFHGCAGEMVYIYNKECDAVETFTLSILTLTCVLDLPEVLVSGEPCSDEVLDEVRRRLDETLPDDRAPLIRRVNDVEQCYEVGLRRRILEFWKER